MRGGSVVVINVWAITVDMFGNVVKGKINVDHISQEHITPATTTTTTPSHQNTEPGSSPQVATEEIAVFSHFSHSYLTHAKAFRSRKIR